MLDDIKRLEQLLQVANDRSERARKALATKHKGGEWEERRAAEQEVLGLERRLAAAKRDEYAEPCDFPLVWDVFPVPYLMVNEYRALLAFFLKDSDREQLGLVQFDLCNAARLGTPNVDVLEGHSLNGKGLEAYRAQRVVNSRWIKELEAINSVHAAHRPEEWRTLNHYVFWFHDSTFECVGRSYTVETHRMSMKELLGLMVERLTA